MRLIISVTWNRFPLESGYATLTPEPRIVIHTQQSTAAWRKECFVWLHVACVPSSQGHRGRIYYWTHIALAINFIASKESRPKHKTTGECTIKPVRLIQSEIFGCSVVLLLRTPWCHQLFFPINPEKRGSMNLAVQWGLGLVRLLTSSFCQ